MCNKWTARLMMALFLWVAASTHAKAFADVANTPWGMFTYHGGAAMVDLLSLIVCSYGLQGQLSEAMQTSCLVSMVVNFLGWLAYILYAPPTAYNAAISGVSLVQLALLLFVGRYGSDYLGYGMVPCPDRGRPQFHIGKASQ
jgi:hypothetical protein